MSISFVICIYIAVSIPIFLKVYDTSQNVIDEDFHLKQAKEFCNGHFSKWDPKITTFPGLYLVSYIILPFKFCTTFYLRCISFGASVLNVILIYKILRFKEMGSFVTTLHTINISILPPLYFFAHLYYTDVISVSAVLALYYYWLKSFHKSAAICGFASIMMRQTNVVWVSMFLGVSVINLLVKLIRDQMKYNADYRSAKLKGFFHSTVILAKSLDLLKFIKQVLSLSWCYILVICAFLMFVILNGSIVVGDKSAHIATVHVPQVFYFSVFAVFFGFPLLLHKSLPDYNYLYKRKFLISVMLFLTIVIIHYNTIEHPYLLADNRHYIFYIWNRLYGKYKYFKYAMAPIYLSCTFLIITNLKHKNLSFQCMYYISTIVVLFLQSLIEIRYFIIPYIILRLNLNKNQTKLLIIEFFHHLLINTITFYIFFYKEIWWHNFDYVQKLIW